MKSGFAIIGLMVVLTFAWIGLKYIVSNVAQTTVDTIAATIFGPIKGKDA